MLNGFSVRIILKQLLKRYCPLYLLVVAATKKKNPKTAFQIVIVGSTAVLPKK